jgi:hypothetical protein
MEEDVLIDDDVFAASRVSVFLVEVVKLDETVVHVGGSEHTKLSAGKQTSEASLQQLSGCITRSREHQIPVSLA